VCRPKHVEQLRNIGIINSTTRLHLFGSFYEFYITMHRSMNIKLYYIIYYIYYITLYIRVLVQNFKIVVMIDLSYVEQVTRVRNRKAVNAASS
jgi:hypothetical protein